VTDVLAVPVSALTGANVTESSSDLAWYDGPTLLSTIDGVVLPSDADRGLRLPVQTVLRTADFRGYGGVVASGTLRRGDHVKVAGSGQSAVVTRLLALAGEEAVELESGSSGQSVAVELDRDIDIARWDLLSIATDSPVAADRFSADLVWLGEDQLAHGRSYVLRSGPLEVPATITAVRHLLDVTTGAELAALTLSMNEVGRV